MNQRPQKSGFLIVTAALAVAFAGCGIDLDPQKRISRNRLEGNSSVCPRIAVACEAGQEPADVDGDGCALECRDVAQDGGAACIEIAIECPDGTVATDVDGDGCAFECAAASDGGHCGNGGSNGGEFDGGTPTEPTDPTDAGIACPRIAVVCADGSEPIDADGDGCAHECQPIENDAGIACAAVVVECADGSEPIDADGDGCAFECSGVNP